MIQKIRRRLDLVLQPQGHIKKEIAKRQKDFLDSNNLTPISEFNENDVFIAGFPKSGNTWMQHMLTCIIFGIDPELLPDTLVQELVPDVHTKTYYKQHFGFTCFKTHNLPQPNYKRVIHLIRDGRDAMASYYAMNKALGKNISLEEMIVDGKGVFPCKWHEHTKKWLENPFNAEIITVRYEDLLKNPFEEMIKVCSFLGIKRKESIIKNAISGNSFQSMQKKEEKYGWNNPNWDKNEKFVRKGKIGSYKEEIPPALIDFFENEAEDFLTFFKYQ